MGSVCRVGVAGYRWPVFCFFGGVLMAIKLPEINWKYAPRDAVAHVNDKSGFGWFSTVAPHHGPESNFGSWVGYACFDEEGFIVEGEHMQQFHNDAWKDTLQLRPKEDGE